MPDKFKIVPEKGQSYTSPKYKGKDILSNQDIDVINNNIETIKYIYKYLTEKGLPESVTVGLLGNIGVESKFNPAARQVKGPAKGLLQLEGDRFNMMEESAPRTSLFNRTKNWADLDNQLDYIAEEFKNADTKTLTERFGNNKKDKERGRDIFRAAWPMKNKNLNTINGKMKANRLNALNQEDPISAARFLMESYIRPKGTTFSSKPLSERDKLTSKDTRHYDKRLGITDYITYLINNNWNEN